MLQVHPLIREDLEAIEKAPVGWDKLRGQTVLITGAGGLIASYLVYTLLHLNESRGLGITVLALVRNREKAQRHFAPLLDRPDFRLLVQDVCSTVGYEGQIGYILHAASQSSPRQFTADPVGTIRANTVGTSQMLELAASKGAAGFLMLSTREIYGAAPPERAYTREEDYGAFDPTLVRSCYPESKRMAETLCASYAAQYGVPARVARIAHTYGPGIAIGDGRVVGDFLANVIRGEDIVMNSDGSAVLGLTYIRDLVAGLYLVLLDGREFVYNVSSMDGVLTVRELAQTLAALYPERHIGVRFQEISAQQRAGYLSHRVPLLDSHRLLQAGWKPSVDIPTGMRRTVAYYESR